MSSFSPFIALSHVLASSETQARHHYPLFEKAYQLGDQQALYTIQQNRRDLGLSPMQVQSNYSSSHSEATMRKFVGLYKQYGEVGLRQMLSQQDLTSDQIDHLITVIKQMLDRK